VTAIVGGHITAVDLEVKLPAGRYTMLGLIAVNGNAVNADIKRIPILIASKS